MVFEFLNDKKGVIWRDVLVWWIIALVVLFLMIMLYLTLSGKAIGALEYIKNLFRFGR